jgi:hypothetical protein
MVMPKSEITSETTPSRSREIFSTLRDDEWREQGALE